MRSVRCVRCACCVYRVCLCYVRMRVRESACVARVESVVRVAFSVCVVCDANVACIVCMCYVRVCALCVRVCVCTCMCDMCKITFEYPACLTNKIIQNQNIMGLTECI